MTRAAFDNSCDLVYGPDGLFPLTVYASGPCRVVPELYEHVLLNPFNLRAVYITLDFAIPNQASVSSVGEIFTLDMSAADIIVVPSGGATTYRVLFVERVDYAGHPTYWRAHCDVLE